MKTIQFLLLVISLLIVSCDTVSESAKGLTADNLIGKWEANSSILHQRITYTGKTIYYMSGLTGIIWDTVTVDTAHERSDTLALSAADNFLELLTDNSYQLQLDSCFLAPTSLNDYGSWSFDAGSSQLELQSAITFDKTAKVGGTNELSLFSVFDTTTYDTIFRVQNVSVPCKATRFVENKLRFE